jgi:hypothetical protein
MILFVRDLVVKDFWLKLFALALAVLIWLTVKFTIGREGTLASALLGRPTDELLVTVPVQASSVDPLAIKIDPPQIDVTLHADPQTLRAIRPDSIRVQVDLAGIQSANGLRRRVDVIVPANVSYTHLSQDEVEVSVSPKH